MSISYAEIKLSTDQLNVLSEIKKDTYIMALHFLNKLYNYKTDSGEKLQLATSESLTCGLIMSTLVDIPFGANLKYGCFGVYDTDAKRVFNHVTVDDVYTHKCASEMAIGVLKNSNATISISVTGNAKPSSEHINRLGEVFIGIAGYKSDTEIIYITKSINACVETQNKKFKDICFKWYSKIANDPTKKILNDRKDTLLISLLIRYYTTLMAYYFCMEFISTTKLCVPDFIKKQKKDNDYIDKNNNHINIPSI